MQPSMAEPPSFEQLWESSLPTLLAWCHLRMTAPLRRRMEPEDVVNEVWLRAQARFAEFDPTLGSVVGWLIGIARNVCLEELRKATNPRERNVAGESDLQLHGVRPRSTLSVRSRLANEEAIVHLLAMLEKLREDERELVARMIFEGATCAQVALSWGKSEDAVTKQWQRLRASLRESPTARSFLTLD
jgi:RNA polymerase sigma-70 factor (ECF subfamily)